MIACRCFHTACGERGGGRANGPRGDRRVLGQCCPFPVPGARRVVVVGRPVGAARFELERLGVGRFLHGGPEAVVVDELDRFDRVFRGDAGVGEADEIVAVVLFAAGGQVEEPANTCGLSLLKSVTTNLWWMTWPAPPPHSARNGAGTLLDRKEKGMNGELAGSPRLLDLQGAIQPLGRAEGIELGP